MILYFFFSNTVPLVKTIHKMKEHSFLCIGRRDLDLLLIPKIELRSRRILNVSPLWDISPPSSVSPTLVLFTFHTMYNSSIATCTDKYQLIFDFT